MNNRITAADIALYFRQFSTLISANIPLVHCCDMLEKSQEKPFLRLLIRAIRREILSGKSLHASFSHYPYYFNDFICHLIRIGEQTGRLDNMLSIIAAHLEKNQAFKKKIKQALFYPGLVMLTGIGMIFILLLFVIPRFAELFESSQVSLPTLTIWIFYFSEHLLSYLAYLSFLALFFFFISYRLKPPPSFKQPWQQCLHALPFIKPVRKKIVLARFAKHLAITLNAGIPLTDALLLTANACNDQLFLRLLTQVRNQVNTGMPLYRAMETFPIFTVLVTQMIKMGEHSGTLPLLLNKISDMQDAEIDQLFSYLSQLVEPLIMVILGALIGGLVIGMYLPIFKLGSTL